MASRRLIYGRHRFPAEIIGRAVWLYHCFSLSLRDVELILAERGIVMTHESARARRLVQSLHESGVVGLSQGDI